MFDACIRYGSVSAFVLAVALHLIPPASATDRPVIATTSGKIAGRMAGDVEVFEGIRYAAPPLKKLRWAPPVDPIPWTNVADATKPGAPCPQPGPAGGLGGNLPGDNEDCLFLNVWRPKSIADDAALPVLVWFHGGGMQSGAAHLYEGSWLATRGTPTIVVTVNYRLAVLGFLAHPALTAEHPELASGNYGILDEQFALWWIQRNIRQFGGDPQRVTIAGESGGAQAVCVQMASPLAKGLFQRAISQSGGCQWNFPRLPDAEAKGLEIAADLGCSGQGAEALACLRRLPASKFLAPQGSKMTSTGAPSGAPAVGGGVLPYNIREAFAFGGINAVPLMQGLTEDEALYYVGPFFDGAGKPVKADEYIDLLRGFFGTHADEVATHYPLSRYASPSHAFSRAIGDSGLVFMSRIGACNTQLANRLAAGRVKLFAYEFADPEAPFPAPMFPFSVGKLKGPGHTSELTYLFDNDFALTPAQRRLSNQMINYWTRFAAHGDPNGPDLPVWPAFTADNENVQILKPNATKASATFDQDHQCALWSRYGYNSLYSWGGTISPPPPRR